MTLFSLLCYLGFVSCYTLFAFWLDSCRAGNGGWRLPESRLLLLVAFGGGLGAKLAQALFHHKTRKQPFARRLNRILAVQIVLVALILAAPLGNGMGARFTQVRGTATALLFAPAPEAPPEKVMPRRFGPGS